MSQVKDILFEALQREGAERRAFLDEMCADDGALRAEVERLIAAHERAGQFMGAVTTDGRGSAFSGGLAAGVSGGLSRGLPGGSGEFAAMVAEHQPGAVLGPYRLEQEIGEGGFGTVWLAEQSAPVKRRVAVKIVKPGMDTQHVIARFEAERQALAMMDHPNIARVFDAGATPAGRPYFVMEYVDGLPITQYCDEHRLAVRKRLEILELVCLAVQHAHGKGVIHRDLKPNNILVAHVDGRPVPKIIDFGVAKAVEVKLTAQTMAVTQDRQLVGTPEYMSPEQASFGSDDIDTRSDVYALGVLLYELLVGQAPFEHSRLMSAGLAELERIIREEEPQRPSARLLSFGEGMRQVSRSRGTEPDFLYREIRGDLDWIAIKALEKDRARRYATAHSMAMDLRRHLEDEPVLASPPGRWYRMRKFVRRHRRGVAAASVALAAMFAGVGGIGWGFLEARASASHAVDLNAFMRDILTSAHPERAGADVRLLDVLTQAATATPQRFADDPLQQAEVYALLAEVYLSQSMYKEAMTLLRPAVEIRRERLGPDAVETLQVEADLGSAYSNLHMTEQTAEVAGDLLPRVRRVLGEGHPLTLHARRLLAYVDLREGRWKEAETTLRQLLREAGPLLGRDHLTTVSIVLNLAEAVRARARWDQDAGGEAAVREVATLLADAVERLERNLGPYAYRTLLTMREHADVLDDLGESARAEVMTREILRRMEGRYSEDHWLRHSAYYRLAWTLRRQGRMDEAVEWITRAVDAAQRAIGEDDLMTIAMMTDSLEFYAEAGRHDLREQCARVLYERSLQRRGRGDAWTQQYANEIAAALRAQGREADADAFINAASATPAGDDAAWRQDLLHGRHLLSVGRFDGAEQHLLNAHRLAQAADPAAAPGEDPPVMQTVRALIKLYESWGREDEVATWRARLDGSAIERH